MTKRIAVLLAVTAALVAAVGPSSASAYAPPGNVSAQALYDVTDTGGGVYWRWAPYNADYSPISGYGEYDGYAAALDCYAWGDPVGPYGNRLWYFAAQFSPQPPVGDGQGWISDHYLDTPGTAANPQPVTSRCPGY